MFKTDSANSRCGGGARQLGTSVGLRVAPLAVRTVSEFSSGSAEVQGNARVLGGKWLWGGTSLVGTWKTGILRS